MQWFILNFDDVTVHGPYATSFDAIEYAGEISLQTGQFLVTLAPDRADALVQLHNEGETE